MVLHIGWAAVYKAHRQNTQDESIPFTEVLDLRPLFIPVDLHPLFIPVDLHPLFIPVDLRPLFILVDLRPLFIPVDLRPLFITVDLLMLEMPFQQIIRHALWITSSKGSRIVRVSSRSKATFQPPIV
ncbi:hypothetical protein CEXT_531251 [Caerostris extrusa]|uniref:Uncharacterized protein n=1 Tax=Caerostris extrusa TaxID=172846 RepID=A0AAV4N9S6_CAEEX|nr:hypothetical protein CEXT_531251 [Caerostris extrusa]